MTLFRSQTHQEVWQQHWCHTCFQPDEAQRRLQNKPEMCCPIWGQAMRSGRKPVLWQRNPRADQMVKAITCHAYQEKPPRTNVKKSAPIVDVPMFDVEPTAVRYVPVPGLPDGSPLGPDHA